MLPTSYITSYIRVIYELYTSNIRTSYKVSHCASWNMNVLIRALKPEHVKAKPQSHTYTTMPRPKFKDENNGRAPPPERK